jgi:hypothetical protein
MFITEQQLQERMRQSGFNTGSISIRPFVNPLPIGPNAPPITDLSAHIVGLNGASQKPVDPDIMEVLRFLADKNNTESHGVVMRT